MNLKKIINHSPIASYFILTFFISWTGAFILVASKLFSGQPIPKMSGLLMFPVMLLGPGTAGILLTILTEGRIGLKNFFSRLFKWRISFSLYAMAILIPPVLILLTLFILRNFVSGSFTPNFFPIGILFGIPAGFFEEIGWTGFAVYKMSFTKSAMSAGALIGLLWGLWHFPVIDFLGSATPHGDYLILFFLSFIALLMAMRLLMVWVYSSTKSILIVQLMHAVFTGCLAMLGPSQVTPAQETLWYASYAILLWITVIIIYFVIDRRKVQIHH